ncbi:hypothetical protein [Actinomyces faecalis]|uniref:hypothetical protein n=1 Tax=Actinomyces faecalis TaxID=2722820 RepID=UPI001556129A|nr:hypothetical protein [Actinomyces faecalis]
MSPLSPVSLMPEEWRTTVTVTGPVRRDADGYLTPEDEPKEVSGCLVAPATATTPRLTDPATSQSPSDTATLYAPPTAPIGHLDTVTVPPTHALAGVWQVEATPAVWPMGVVATLTRR